MANREEIIEALKTVNDPELYIDVWTLGLIYDLTQEEGKLNVRMTFTSPACPAGPYLVDEITKKTEALEGIDKTEIEVTFSPPWAPSDELKQMLGID
jgi:metal-sulfur cluster biosynthetic enzyme